MTIEQIDSTKVLISLCTEDMHDFALKYDSMSFNDEHSRKILKRLLMLACNKTGIEVHNKTMVIEALPHESGCLILITLKNRKSGRRIYKIKDKNKLLCCMFESSENFLSAISSLYKLNIHYYGNSAYFFSGKYYIIFMNASLPRRAKAILNEFAKMSICTKTFEARLSESGKLIAKADAISTVGKPLNS